MDPWTNIEITPDDPDAFNMGTINMTLWWEQNEYICSIHSNEYHAVTDTNISCSNGVLAAVADFQLSTSDEAVSLQRLKVQYGSSTDPPVNVLGVDQVTVIDDQGTNMERFNQFCIPPQWNASINEV